LVQAETNAESACHAKIVAGKLPSATPCRDEPATATAIAKARAKLASAIGKACGGKDKTCGAGGDDVPLAEVGWQIGSCPNVKEGACANAITDCGDVAACVTCVGESTVERSMSLYYGALEPTDPSDKTQKPLNQCQSAIGKAGRGLLNAEHKALAKCWTAVSAGKANGTCPATDAKAMAAIAKAEAHAEEAICKACGGTDKACATPDDFTPTAIGFVPTCPDITPPGAASCNGTIATLQDLVACSDCGTSFGANCALLATVPGLATYPDECAP
jgi:hypothetical protein